MKIQLQPLLDEIQKTLAVSETVTITTSGYGDRWLSQRLRYTMTVFGAPIEFPGNEELHQFVYNAIRTARGSQNVFDSAACQMASDICRVRPERWVTYGTWSTPVQSQTNRINREAVRSFLELRTHKLIPEAESKCRAEILKLTEFDKQFLRHGLTRCNEANAALVSAGLRNGHTTQVDSTVE